MNLFRITSNFKNEIYNNVVHHKFPNLNKTETLLLSNYLCKLINYISHYNGFFLDHDETLLINKYIKYFQFDNYQHLHNLLLLLLPYINDPLQTNQFNITFLKEIYLNRNQCDINLESPKYQYSNIQYNRCIRQNPIIEYDTIVLDIQHNFNLLCETVIKMANRFFINWSTVLPITITDYMNNSLYKNTYNAFINHNLQHIDFIKTSNLRNHPLHLYAGHIYDALNFYFIENIIEHKWMIINIHYDDNEHQQYNYPLFAILKIIFDYSFNIDDSDKFYNLIFKLFQFTCPNDSQQSITIGKYIIDKQNAIKIIVALIVFFDNFYPKKTTNYISLNLNSIDKQIFFERNIIFNAFNENYNKYINNFSQTLLSITPRELSNFIYISYEQIKTSWYGYYLNDPSTNLNFSHLINNHTVFTPELIYLYAISITGTTPPANKYWCSLNNNEHQHVINMFNDFNNSKIKKIVKSYVKFELIGYEFRKDSNIKQLIHKILNDKICDVIFQALIINGSLSFINFKDLTNTQLYEYESGYNFINNTAYNSSQIQILNNNQSNNISYMQFINDYHSNIKNIMTLTWPNQLLFFHKYINNRVLLVTGGTGVGKSSQVPKLTLYALKIIDYKLNGQIICTQPTISAVTKNALHMSEELGVPIQETLNSNNMKFSEKNFNIQFEYKNKKKSHYRNIDKLMLKFVTDGILLQNIINYPMIFKSNNKKHYFLPQNLYDIIIIDESHTHNLNMDVILTFLKYAVYYNNTIKLLIISATMDSDEHYYRRFFRDINNNKIFPLNTFLKTHNLDRISIDMRYHVGSKLRFPVTEYYKPNFNYKMAINEILNTSSSGDILLFQTGAGDILNAVANINKFTPYDVLALPLFSKMDDSDKNVIFNLKDNRSKIIQSKNSNSTHFKLGNDSPYNRFIIVATNVVEASITIDSLKFVIDNGFYKSQYFDFNINKIVTNDKTPISEQSRLQRRGRVGRVSSGSVYYLYEQNSRADVKHNYDITIIDLKNFFYEFLSPESQNNLLNVPDKYNPNLITFNLNFIKNSPQIQSMFFSVLHMYYNNSGFEYYGNNNLYDYKFVKTPPAPYFGGYSMINLTDNNGQFYLIHPEENNIIRNLKNDITGTLNSNIKYQNNVIETFKILNAWEKLKSYFFIFDKTNKKTQFGNFVFQISKIFETFEFQTNNLEFAISYVYSRKYNCLDFLKLIAFYFACSFLPKNIFDDSTILNTQSSFSDSELFLSLITLFDRIKITFDPSKFNDNVDSFFDILNGKFKTISDFNINLTDKYPYLLNNFATIFTFDFTKYHNIKQSFIINYYKTYLTILFEFILLENQIHVFEWCDKHLMINNLSPNHLYNYNLSFLHGFYENIVKSSGNQYYKINDFNLKNSISVKTHNNKILTNFDYLLFLNYDNQNKLTFIHGLREIDVMSLSHIYNYQFISNILQQNITVSIPYYRQNINILKYAIKKYFNSDNIKTYQFLDDSPAFFDYINTLCKETRASPSLYYLTK